MGVVSAVVSAVVSSVPSLLLLGGMVTRRGTRMHPTLSSSVEIVVPRSVDSSSSHSCTWVRVRVRGER